MSHKTTPAASQESLFVANQQTGEIVERNFSDDTVAVTLLEHDLYQLNVLELFGKINQRAAFIEVPRFTAKHRDPQASIDGAMRERNELKRRAMLEFGRSTGLFVLKDSGLVEDMTPYQHETRARWEIFREAYAAPAKQGERRDYMKWLRNDIKELQTGRTKFNRRHGLRPHAPDNADVQRRIPQPRIEETPDKKLTTRDRLIAILGDPRAGFLPTTHTEKNQALLYLDYLDNPAYPLGINNQYFEVFIHNQIIPGPNAGLSTAQEAMVSIPHELIDHFSDAVKSLDYLRMIDEETAGVNPTVQAMEVLGRTDPVFAFLVRYRDGMEVVRTGKAPRGIRDPFTTHEDRQPHFGFVKNKTLQDVYTRGRQDADTAAYIAAEAEGWTLKDLRKLLAESMTNELIRKDFWAQRMLDFNTEETKDQKFLPMWEVVQPTLREYGYIQSGEDE